MYGVIGIKGINFVEMCKCVLQLGQTLNSKVKYEKYRGKGRTESRHMQPFYFNVCIFFISNHRVSTLFIQEVRKP